jgi:hypothetical protein
LPYSFRFGRKEGAEALLGEEGEEGTRGEVVAIPRPKRASRLQCMETALNFLNIQQYKKIKTAESQKKSREINLQIYPRKKIRS